MARFVTQRDFEFIQHITRELIDETMDVAVVLYKIVIESAKVNIYDYGKLTPIYSDSVTQNAISTVTPYVLKTTNISLGAGLVGSTNFTQDTISVGLDYEYVQEQVRENYVHDQQVASSTWVVPHALNKFPSVSIVNTANQAVMGDITYNSLNQITITFTSQISGKAYIN